MSLVASKRLEKKFVLTSGMAGFGHLHCMLEGNRQFVRKARPGTWHVIGSLVIHEDFVDQVDDVLESAVQAEGAECIRMYLLDHPESGGEEDIDINPKFNTSFVCRYAWGCMGSYCGGEAMSQLLFSEERGGGPPCEETVMDGIISPRCFVVDKDDIERLAQFVVDKSRGAQELPAWCKKPFSLVESKRSREEDNVAKGVHLTAYQDDEYEYGAFVFAGERTPWTESPSLQEEEVIAFHYDPERRSQPL